ncbi:hypothetical protein AKJ16_DCAP20053 [Drosera capensis]
MKLLRYVLKLSSSNIKHVGARNSPAFPSPATRSAILPSISSDSVAGIIVFDTESLWSTSAVPMAESLL